MKLLLLLALLGLSVAPALAQSCAPRNSQGPTAISWPEGSRVSPVWTLTFLPPSSSTGTVASGLEIRDVYYNGHLVMKRGHVPILNVKYETGCNCYRDWSYSDQRFVADNPVGTCYAESTPGTVATMCDVTPSNCVDNNGDGEVDSCSDVGSFSGVAVERFDDRLVLSTQMSAGWYRYTMRWEFHADGTIRPLFGFTSTGSACTQNPRRHHSYWRFDFDIDGGESDYAVETSAVAEDVVFETETTRLWNEPADGVAWSVLDLATERGYRVAPSEVDYDTPANPNTGIPALDNFAREDFVVARYQPGEYDDGVGFSGSSCDAKFEGGGNASVTIVNGEDVFDEDIVLWYRSGVTKDDIDPGTCYASGPVLTPIGDWSNNPPVGTEDEGAAPSGYTLDKAYPNPFDQTTTLRFSVEEAQRVTLTLYDALGREVRTLFEGTPPAGVKQSVVLDGAALPSGVYTVRLEGAAFSESTRVVLLK
ncbi:MAG: T9SS type A sorting domain-containing protein [Rhodothermales bacterium]